MTTTASTAIVTPHPGCGVEITGVDLRHLDDATFTDVRDQFHQHGLVFFRDQQLSPSDHIAFARRLGTINVNRFFTKHADHPEIALVVKEPDQKINVGGFWHTDHSYDVEPALGSILVARELPDSGGDTHFLSMYDAFDCLPAKLQDRLRGLSAVHSGKHVFGSATAKLKNLLDPKLGFENAEAADALESVVHPCVIRHPLSGREALYVNPSFTLRIEGMSLVRSTALLVDVYRRVLDAERIAKFSWAPGSVAMWDNRATWHNAKNDYRGQRREMHRITLDGCPIEAAA